MSHVLKYGVFPFAYMAGLAAFRDNAKATQWARLSGATASAMLTTAFLGLESQTMDSIVRDAVTAEMGLKPDDFKTSDCRYSKNIIAQKGYTDLVRLQPMRYFKDAMFLLPTLVEGMYKGTTSKRHMPSSKVIRNGFDFRNKPNVDPGHSTLDILANGHFGWDMAVYSATSAYWAFETFAVNKKGYYPVAQDIIGKIKPTDGYITENHLMDIYQRCRHDRGHPMIEWKEEHKAIKPILKRLVDAYNEHDGKIDVPEIVYLFGMNKINVHGPDNRTLSPEAVAESNKNIDHVIEVGLEGIREENRKKRASVMDLASPTTDQSTSQDGSSYQERVSRAIRNEEDQHKGFVDRFADVSIRATQGALSKVGMLPKRPESYISAADPTELIGADSAIRGFR